MFRALLLIGKPARSIFPLALLCVLLLSAHSASAQETGAIRGRILDPASALVPGAEITITRNRETITTISGPSGQYGFRTLKPGRYSLAVTAKGFAQFLSPEIRVEAGRTQIVNVSLVIAVAEQNIQVLGHSTGINTNPNNNANALVMRGAGLNALSDNPDQMQSELQALAGPAAGPNGGQIYIDGFTGGQFPPKSSIREIRINQNPFSAEFDRLGYGRIEIFTKPGAEKFHGRIMGFGNTSALDTTNPLLVQRPSYYNYDIRGHIDGPLFKHRSSYFLSMGGRNLESQSIVSAINPDDPSRSLEEAVLHPKKTLFFSPRFDFSVGSNDTVIVRDSLNYFSESGAGVGQWNLSSQAYRLTNLENDIQAEDSHIVNSHFLTETRFQWRRIRNAVRSATLAPAVIVQGAFVSGGNALGDIDDHQDLFELANTSTLAVGRHTISFGTRLRSYRDSNASTAGGNGSYTFSSLDRYVARTPDQYTVTVIRNPLARVLLFDGALFVQDDWRWRPNFTLSYGLRFEGQNRISDHADWAPRLALAWGLDRTSNGSSKTVLRAGYGWFYDRFTVPDSFTSSSGTPYILQAIHQDLINQATYLITSPDFFQPGRPGPPPEIDRTAIPTTYSVDPDFHAALDMQTGVGVDRELTRSITSNVTYLFTRGVHQYLTNNVSAPTFNPSTYQVTGPTPHLLNYQFQSGGVYSEHEVIATLRVHRKRLSIFGTYTYTHAKGDTEGVEYFPSVAQDPGVDYGRPAFDIRNRVSIIGNLSLPGRISFAPFFIYSSGAPYNITIGKDLTGNNQFNARPTYGVCGTPGVVTTPYGCLDTDPAGKREQIVPFGLGTGPSNVLLNLRISKVIGIGPRIGKTGPTIVTSSRRGRGAGSHGLTGGSGPGPLDALSPRKYKLTLVCEADNALNIVNWAPPNGVLSSPLFGTSQALAGGPFTIHTPGNRSIYVQAMFSF